MKKTIAIIFVCAIHTLLQAQSSSTNVSYGTPDQSNCLDQMKKGNRDKKGPIRIRVEIDSLVMGQQNYYVGLKNEFKIKNESELIILNDSVALKLFHVTAVEHGKNRHLIKHELYVKRTECWYMLNSFNYAEVHSTNSIYGKGSFSVGYKEDKDFVKVVWLVSRID